MMAECIRTDRDCAQLCWTTSALLARDSEFSGELCAVCAKVCQACADECAKHDHQHCQKCAEACRQCAEECGNMKAAMV